MPKNLNYPLASFQKAFALADAVDALGGSCSVEHCAEKMRRKISGGFMVIISSAQKFELVSFEKGMIAITENYKLIKHAYTNTERINFLQKAFLAPQVFSVLFERFRGKELPVPMLDKILIREFGVEEITAGRVAGYFTDGLKTCGLLNGSLLADGNAQETAEQLNTMSSKQETIYQQKEVVQTATTNPDTSFSTANATADINCYEVQFSGPGIITTLNLKMEEDILILEAIIKKVRKDILK